MNLALNQHVLVLNRLWQAVNVCTAKRALTLVFQGHAQVVLDAPDGSLCYTGDSGSSDDIVELARGCDVLIHMNHYFSGTAPSPAYRAACGNHKDNALVAQRAGVKTLVLTHLLAQIDQPRIREQIVHEIQAVFEGKVVWGEDLMELTFAGPRIAGIEGY